MQINNENFVTIYGWMRTKLNLKGNDLIVYAVIYAFTQSDEQGCKGGVQFLADWCGASRQGIWKNIRSLRSKGLIDEDTKTVNGVNSVYYYVTQLTEPVNSVDEPVNSVDENGKLSLHSNYNRVIGNKKENNIRGKFAAPCVEDVAAYCKEHSYTIDAQAFVDFNEMKGWMVGKSKMKDWKAAVRTWERNNAKRSNSDEIGPNGVKLLPKEQMNHTLDGIL